MINRAADHNGVRFYSSTVLSIVLLVKATIGIPDPLHLARAGEYGYTGIFSNNRHLVAAAGHFGLRGVNIIS